MLLPDRGGLVVPRWGSWLIALACIAVAALAAWLGTFTHPQADDYIYASLVREHGLIGAQVEYYMRWNGRVVASALCFFTLGAEMPLPVYRAIPAVVLVGLLVAFRAFVGALLPRGAPAHVCWLLAGILTILYFTAAPSTREGFYWLSGTLNYQPSHILGLLLAAVLLRPVRGARLIAPLLALLMAMANESGMLVELILLVAGTTWAFATRSTHRALWLITLAGCAAGMALDLGAPGLRVRQAVHDASSLHEKDFLWSLAGSFSYAGRAALRLAAHPAFWGSLIIGLPWLVRRNGTMRRPICRVWLVLVPILWLGCAAAALFPVQFASGVNPPGRIMNVAAWVLVAGALPASACVVALLSRLTPIRTILRRLPASRMAILATVAIAAGMFLNQNAIRMVRESGKAASYDRQMTARSNMLQAAEPGAAVVVPRLTDRPGSICFHDMPTDPANWHNQVIARYYGLASVSALESR